ncbi:putative SOS response-associated peptidase YedK [Nocardioides thalensis]|uniref:Abasic site processing protein n=1 Tax=Nocardioides thalensis TaxID=1914755 RepID=A0A853C623_9ACTN|nr:SOS response-associated peptidase [Nocardioides thalensis]NYJ02132.1 putative SOS response-associated peptidase YedK [Nocardioides thalensis]
MCGRYASSRSPDDLAEEFEVVDSRLDKPLAPDYNVAPTKDVYAVLERQSKEHPDEPPARQLRTLRWGLVPSWAKDPGIGSKMINARMETVAEKPAFRKAFAVRRCLLPADGYFEWYPTEQKGKSGKPIKQPFYIHPADGSVMAMAGLYEIWKDPTRDDDDPDRFRWTCTVLTTDAPDELGKIHDRMPLLVTRDNRDAWLDPGTEKDRLLDLLVPAQQTGLQAYPVSPAVGNVRNNGPELVEPLPLEDSLL